MNIYLLGIALLVLIFLVLFYKKIFFLVKEIVGFVADIIKYRFLLVQITKRDFKTKYLGTYFGLPWAFIQPSITIFILWFVMTFAFKNGDVAGAPYILWLVSGMVPWLFITEALSSGSNVLVEYSYLLKKVNIRTSLIPIIKTLSAFIIHVFLVIVVIAIAIVSGKTAPLYWVQVLYYIFATMYLCIGMTFMTASANVFVRDIGQFMGVFLQMVFWATPIFWQINMIPEKLRIIFYLNPFYYIISGYRDTFVFHKYFWTNVPYMIYFWSLATIIFLCGAVIFKRLRPHFGDVL